MTTITEYGKQNIFANETPPRLMNEKESDFVLEQAERTNGQLAMVGFVAALGAYITTGQILNPFINDYSHTNKTIRQLAAFL